MTQTDTLITFLDLATGTVRTGQYWSDAPLVTNRHAVWAVVDGTPIHVHKVAARHNDTQRALRSYDDVPEYITGVVRHLYGTPSGRYDDTKEN